MRWAIAAFVLLGCAGRDIEDSTTSDPSSGGTEGSSSGGTTSEGTSAATTAVTSSGCPIGQEGCPCTEDATCNPPFVCNTNLNICISDTCPVGTEGCACTPFGACDPGLICVSEFCVPPG